MKNLWATTSTKSPDQGGRTDGRLEDAESTGGVTKYGPIWVESQGGRGCTEVEALLWSVSLLKDSSGNLSKTVVAGERKK